MHRLSIKKYIILFKKTKLTLIWSLYIHKKINKKNMHNLKEFNFYLKYFSLIRIIIVIIVIIEKPKYQNKIGHFIYAKILLPFLSLYIFSLFNRSSNKYYLLFIASQYTHIVLNFLFFFLAYFFCITLSMNICIYIYLKSEKAWSFLRLVFFTLHCMFVDLVSDFI